MSVLTKNKRKLYLLTDCVIQLLAFNKLLIKFYCRNILLGSAWIEVPALEHTSLVRRIRLPQEGLFDEFITCVLVSII